MNARAAGDTAPSRWISPTVRVIAGRARRTTAPRRLASCASAAGSRAAPAPASASGTIASRAALCTAIYLTAREFHTAVVGLQLSAIPVATALTAPLAGRLVTRIGDRLLTGASLIVAAGGLMAIALRHDTGGAAHGSGDPRGRARRVHPRQQRRDHVACSRRACRRGQRRPQHDALHRHGARRRPRCGAVHSRCQGHIGGGWTGAGARRACHDRARHGNGAARGRTTGVACAYVEPL